MKSRALLAFVLLLIGARIVFVLGCLDPTQEPVRETMDQAGAIWYGGPERPLYDREELYTATAAEAIRLGVDLPASTYRFMAYGSGSLLISLLAVPLYAVFGPHYLTFKIIALLVTVIGGISWFSVVRAWAGQKAAWVFGVLYLVGPPALVRTALIAKGDHPEAMAIAGVVLWLFTRAAQAPTPRSRSIWAVLTGLLAGLGVYVTYSTVPVVAGVVVAALILSRARPFTAWATGVVGLGLGLIPWIATVIATKGAALRVYNAGLGDTGVLPEAASRVSLLLSTGFLASYDLPGGSGAHQAAALLFTIAVLGSWVALAWRAKEKRSVLAAAATLAFLAAFCLRAPDASSRYLLPGYPLLILSIAFWVAGSPGQALARFSRVGLVLFCMLAVVGLISQVHSIADSRFIALRTPLKGTDWPLLGEIVGQKLTPDQIKRQPEHVRPYLWIGLGTRAMHTVAPQEWPDAAALAGEEAQWMWEGIGVGLSQSPGWEKIAGEHLPAFTPEARQAVCRGLARYADELLPFITVLFGPQVTEQVVRELPPENTGEVLAAATRSTAVLSTHGVPLGERAPAGAVDLYLNSKRASTEFAAAAGWALVREVGHGGTLRLWPAAEGSWTSGYVDGLRSGSAPGPSWQGVAHVYERQLRARTRASLLGDQAGPAALAEEISSMREKLPASAVQLLARAAGQACGAALVTPQVGGPPPSAESWNWRKAWPDDLETAFAAGLAEASPLPR